MHNVGQLTAASIVLGTTKIYYYFPFLLVSGVITGIFVGLAAKHLIQALDRIEWFRLSAERG
ncbi:Heptaprenyl diphosphate synthase component I [compost metagenome]